MYLCKASRWPIDLKGCKWGGIQDMNLQSGLSIFFKSTSTSLFTGGTFYSNLNNFHKYIIQHSLISGGTKDHLRQVKVPGTAPYWRACQYKNAPIFFSTKWMKIKVYFPIMWYIMNTDDESFLIIVEKNPFIM